MVVLAVEMGLQLRIALHLDAKVQHQEPFVNTFNPFYDFHRTKTLTLRRKDAKFHMGYGTASNKTLSNKTLSKKPLSNNFLTN